MTHRQKPISRKPARKRPVKQVTKSVKRTRKIEVRAPIPAEPIVKRVGELPVPLATFYF
jgi:hypothetical protein